MATRRNCRHTQKTLRTELRTVDRQERRIVGDLNKLKHSMASSASASASTCMHSTLQSLSKELAVVRRHRRKLRVQLSHVLALKSQLEATETQTEVGQVLTDVTGTMKEVNATNPVTGLRTIVKEHDRQKAIFAATKSSLSILDDMSLEGLGPTLEGDKNCRKNEGTVEEDVSEEIRVILERLIGDEVCNNDVRRNDMVDKKATRPGKRRSESPRLVAEQDNAGMYMQSYSNVTKSPYHSGTL